MSESAYATGLQIPNSCDDACAEAYLPIYRDCYPTLQTVAQFQGAGALEAFDALNAVCQMALADDAQATVSAGMVNLALGLPTGQGSCAFDPCVQDGSCGVDTDHSPESYDTNHHTGLTGAGAVAVGILCPFCGFINSAASHDETVHHAGANGVRRCGAASSSTVYYTPDWGGEPDRAIDGKTPNVEEPALWGEDNPGSGQMCEGDCDDDSECEGNLICWQRDSTEVVPGCGTGGVSDTDYCTTGIDTQELCAVTDAAPSWWQLDLGRPAHIDHVSVYQKGQTTAQQFLFGDNLDECDDHVGSANVIVSTTPFFSAGTVCGPLNDPTEVPGETACDGAEGQFITISNSGSSSMVICEVEVWGSWAPGRTSYAGGWNADPCGQP